MFDYDISRGYLYHDCNIFLFQLWNITGDQGNKWIQGTVNVGLQGDFFLVMEAIMKSGFRGDIAIDDIQFVNCAIGEEIDNFSTF